MQVETLNIFCDVVRHRSFSRGALANSVSQSAASQAVRQLEKHLGTKLIDRSKRPWELTSEGQVVYEGCQQVVERFHELEDRVRRRQDPAGHTVRVAAIYSIGLHNLSQSVNQFRSAEPGATVELTYMHPEDIAERILQDQADLGLLSFVPMRRELTVIPWRRQPMVVVCPPSHRLADIAAQNGIQPGELARERFVAFDRQLSVRREIDRFLRRHGVEVAITAAFDNIETIKQAVDEGAGVAILPEPTVRREVARGTLVQIPLVLSHGEPPLVRPLTIVHRKNRWLNPAVTEFIKLLQTDGNSAPTTPVHTQSAPASSADIAHASQGETWVRAAADEGRTHE